MAGQGVIAFRKIGTKRFLVKIDLGAGVKFVMVSLMGINQKIRGVTNLHVEAFAEQIIEGIVGLVKAGVKVTKIESQSLHCLPLNAVPDSSNRDFHCGPIPGFRQGPAANMRRDRIVFGEEPAIPPRPGNLS
jgi:hypothetical protein